VVQPIQPQQQKPELFFPKPFLTPTPSTTEQPKTPGQK